jgi:hypothetical protein
MPGGSGREGGVLSQAGEQPGVRGRPAGQVAGLTAGGRIVGGDEGREEAEVLRPAGP